jgi:hypothetical protein
MSDTVENTIDPPLNQIQEQECQGPALKAKESLQNLKNYD